MKINKDIILFLSVYLTGLYTAILFTGEQEPNITVIAVPGIFYNEKKSGYSETILQLLASDCQVHKTGTLSLAQKPDFAQSRCIDHLINSIDQNNNNDIFFVATSQGSGTTTNYLSECNTKENNRFVDNVKGILCEGYPASFNQSLVHTIENEYPVVRYLPFRYYWLPYVVKYFPYYLKTFFPFICYDPTKKQPFENLEHLPKDMPIIFVHRKQDTVTPHDGAEIAYHILMSTGHTKTYLISVDSSSTDKRNIHINVLHNNGQQQKDLQELIVALLNGKHNATEISRNYQPDVEQFAYKTEMLKNREWFLRKVSVLFSTIKHFAFLYALYTMKSFISNKKGAFFKAPDFCISDTM